MEPEIDHRCPDCGVAVRSQAAFCPQCGRAMTAAAVEEERQAALAETQAALTENVEPPKNEHGQRGGGNAARPLAATVPSAKAVEPAPAPAEAEPVSLPAQVAREQIASGKVLEPLPEPRARGKGQRMVGAARDVVEERLAPRVEKIRHASNVVWGEAQDDPNLRFILVAVFLFILAIVIILLGTYLR